MFKEERELFRKWKRNEEIKCPYCLLQSINPYVLNAEVKVVGGETMPLRENIENNKAHLDLCRQTWLAGDVENIKPEEILRIKLEEEEIRENIEAEAISREEFLKFLELERKQIIAEVRNFTKDNPIVSEVIRGHYMAWANNPGIYENQKKFLFLLYWDLL